MQFQLTGIQSYDFMDDKGKQVKGNKLHLVNSTPNQIQNFIGYNVKTIGIRDDQLDALLQGKPRQEFVNRNVNIEFDYNGKLANISVITK